MALFRLRRWWRGSSTWLSFPLEALRSRPRRHRTLPLSLELLEPRWVPAGYTVTAQLQVIQTSDVGGMVPAHQVVFFESSVAGYQSLYESVVPGTDAVLLDAGGDGLREMAAFLAGRTNLAAIDIVAHGAPGEVSLGSATLDTASLASKAAALAQVKASLAPGGDLLLWSCDVAAGLPGQQLLQGLASATGAVVAASTRPVGSPALGGDWQLDARTGTVTAAAPFATDGFTGLLSASSTTSLTSKSSPAFGSLLSLSVTVTGSGNTPTGSVTLDEGTTNLGTAALGANGTASFTLTTLSAGKHTLTAVYGGDANFSASSSAALTQTITTAATSIAVMGSTPNPAATGVAVTFTAAVFTGAGGIAPGSVTFLDSGTSLGTGSLDANGLASFATSTLSAGVHTISAVYGGTANFGSSTSASYDETVVTDPITVTVTTNADDGTGSLRQALQNTPSGATINFASSLDGQTIQLSSGSLTIANNVTIVGPGPGLLTIQGNRTFALFVINTGVTASISGLAITNGSGGINNNGMLALTNCAITGNVSSGGIYSPGPLTLTNCNVSDNSASTASGAVYNHSTLLITGSTFVGNNDSPYGGGAIGMDDPSTLVVTGSTFTSNTAGTGGAIYFGGTAATISGSSFTGNLVNAGGTGALYLGPFGGQLTIIGCTIASNTCSNDGGTIYNRGLLQLINSTVADNSGDGINDTTTMEVVNSTITGNSVTGGQGGGIDGGNNSLRNTILAGNTGDFNGGSLSAQNSLIGDGTNTGLVNGNQANQVGTSANPVNPQLGPLQNNGGPTQTEAILAGSPAIGQGLNAVLPATDQRGFNRVVNGTVDIGAFEVQPFDVTATVIGSANTTAWGQTSTFTASVQGTLPTSSTPTGTVTFEDNSTSIGQGVLNASGMAAFSTTTLSVSASPHTISAVYGGDTNFSGSVSNAFIQTVTRATTSTSLTSSAATSTFGNSVSFTATVISSGTLATGTVTFDGGTNSIGQGTLNAGGVATFSTTTLSVTASPHTISAVYSGDSNFTGSTSNSLTQVVTRNTTSALLTASAGTTAFNNGVSFTATITVSGTLAAGTVTFEDSGVPIHQGVLSAGVATFSTTALSVTASPHTISAVYNGSNSNSLIEVVTPNASRTALTSSAATTIFGTGVTFTAVAISSGTLASGTVTFEDGAAVLGTIGINQATGTATFSTSTLSATASPHTVSAIYSGEGNFSGSTSNSLTQVVTPNPTTASLMSSAATTAFGASVTFTANVTVGGTLASGTVTFDDGNTSIGQGVLAAGTATFSTTTLSVVGSPHTISAVYGSTTSNSLAQVVTPNTSSTALMSSVLPISGFEEGITFTATVTSSGTLATGTVSFDDGSSSIGQGTLSASGVATFSTSTLSAAASPHTISAVYGGDSNFSASTSNSVIQTVTQTSSNTALMTSAATTIFGTSVTFTAVVGSINTLASGTVTFEDGAAVLGTIGINQATGTATFSTNTLSATASPHTVSAIYSGDGNFSGSTSNSLTQVVTPNPTTASLMSSAATTAFGASVTFTANVTVGGTLASGTVTFDDGNTSIGQALLAPGTATFSTATLSVPSSPHTISAVYGSTTSNSLMQVVNPNSSATILRSSAPTTTFDAGVTFTAVVTSSRTLASGTVTFEDGSAVLARISFNQATGTATFSTAFLSATASPHTISALYSGDGNFAGSTSNSVTQSVNRNTASTSVTSQSTPAFGSILSLSVSVTGSGPTPTGTVTLEEGSTILGTAVLTVNRTASYTGTASFTLTTLSAGSHTLTAVYGGDANFSGSSSAAVTQTITTAATSITVMGSTPNPAATGVAVTFTAAVFTGAGGIAPGSVTFVDGSTTLGTGSLDANGLASFATSTLSAGIHTISAVYGGTTNFGTSTSASYDQTVVTTPTTVTVSTNADHGTGSLRQALQNASSGATINFNPSLDGQTIQLTSGSLTIANDVTIAGPGPGLLTIQGNRTFALFVVNTGVTASISGLAITNGSGGINNNGMLALTNCTITGNVGGGGIYSPGPLTLTNCNVSDNSASTASGAVYNHSTLLITGSTFVGNNDSPYGGGAIGMDDPSTLVVTGSTFTNNTAGGGGAISFGGTAATISGSSFTGNLVNGGGIGGALYLGPYGGQLTVIDSTIASNTCSNGGGGIYNNGMLQLINSTVAYNSGDGINDITTMEVVNSTITGNSVSGGQGGGIGGGNNSLRNTILAGNTGDFNGGSLSAQNSLIGDGTNTGLVNGNQANQVGTSANPVNPQLGLLQNNGGPTQTEALLAGSPAVGQGQNAVLPPTDQRGFTRVVHGTVDIGAFEVQPFDVTVSVIGSANTTAWGQTSSFTASVQGTLPTSSTPTGTVTFEDNSTSIGQGVLNASGMAAFSTTTLSVSASPHTISAVYGGDTNFSGSVSNAFIQTVTRATTSTSLTSSAATSTFGNSVSFTATVTSSGTLASGVVTFDDGSTSIGQSGIGVAGVATFSTTTLSLTASPHTISAVYRGDTNFSGSTSNSLAQTVVHYTTSTSLTASSPSSAFGSAVTITATIFSSATLASGTITFDDGSTSISIAVVVAGKATFSTSALSLTASPHTIRAVYSGNANFLGSVSNSLTQTIYRNITNTSVTGPAPTTAFNAGVTFTATVTSSGTLASGTVTFDDGAASLGTGTLSAGLATFSTVLPVLGSHTITAVYSGDTNFSGSTSNSLTQIVTLRFTTTSLTSSAATSAPGANVIFTATVTGQATFSPGGAVALLDNGEFLAEIPLGAGGQATVSISTLVGGTDTLVAVYSGDSNFAASISSSLTQIVIRDASTTSLAASSGTTTFGNAITFTATVSGTLGTATGTVIFEDGNSALGSAPLSSGTATFFTSSLSAAASPHTINALYGGDGNYSGSTSATLTQVVTQAATTINLTAASSTVSFGTVLTVTATVTSSGATPTGTVTFSDGSRVLGALPLSGGQAIISALGMTAGSQTITAAYSGDANFSPSDPQLALPVVVNAPLQVTGVTGTATGFTLAFNEPIATSQLFLYSGVPSLLGQSDVSLMDPSGHNVRGSLVVSNGGTLITYVLTGQTGALPNLSYDQGTLPTGTYTVVLQSGGSGFTDTNGNPLDGGSNYATTFSITQPGLEVSLPDFARGPGQPVNLASDVNVGNNPPANDAGTGIPIRFYNPSNTAQAVSTLTFQIPYNPSLLTITGFAAGNDASGGTISLDTSTAGLALVGFTANPGSISTAASGGLNLIDLLASVPTGAPYDAKELLDLQNISLNGGVTPVGDDNAIQTVTYLGDSNDGPGSGNPAASSTYNGPAATTILNLTVGQVGGFAGTPLVDPFIVGDILGVGSVGGSDATIVLEASVGQSLTTVPPIPGGGFTVNRNPGPDPTLSIPQLSAAPGATVLVPVELDKSDELDSVKLVLSYDTSRLQLVSGTNVQADVLPGSLTQGFTFNTDINPKSGTLVVQATSGTPLSGEGSGSVAVLAFQVKANAPAGAAFVDLNGGTALGGESAQGVQVNLQLSPASGTAAGSVDNGQVDVSPAAAPLVKFPVKPVSFVKVSTVASVQAVTAPAGLRGADLVSVLSPQIVASKVTIAPPILQLGSGSKMGGSSDSFFPLYEPRGGSVWDQSPPVGESIQAAGSDPWHEVLDEDGIALVQAGKAVMLLILRDTANH